MSIKIEIGFDGQDFLQGKLSCLISTFIEGEKFAKIYKMNDNRIHDTGLFKIWLKVRINHFKKNYL